MASNAISKKVGKWVRDQLYKSRKQGQCTRLVLHHVPHSGKLGPEIHTVDITGKDDADIDIYTGELVNAADDYAEGVGQTQTFVVAAYFEEDAERAVARHAFTVHIERGDPDADALTEPADKEGLLKQLMRHQESIIRTTVAGFGTVLGTLQRQNNQLSEMVSKMLDDRVEQADAVEAMMTAKHEREVETKREEVSAAQKAQLMDSVLALMPALVNRVTGQKLLVGTDPIQQQIVKFGEALTPKEVEMIFSSLTDPVKKAAFIDLLELIRGRQGGVGDEKTTEEKPS